MNTGPISIYQERINKHLAHIATDYTAHETLQNAIKYSLLSGGKRVRPSLVYATAELINYHDFSLLDDIAASLEMIHCYSLIHDDLPAMDDDDLRRGQPSCHKKFSEAIAILAGDALQTLAFTRLSQSNNRADLRLKLINLLTTAAGMMVQGQALDIEAENKNLSQAELENLHQRKTGALISAAIMMPAYASSSLSAIEIQALQEFSKNIGLLFQIQDDISDYDTNNSDQKRKLTTYPSLMGLDNAKNYAQNLLAQSLTKLAEFFVVDNSNLARVAKEIVGY